MTVSTAQKMQCGGGQRQPRGASPAVRAAVSNSPSLGSAVASGCLVCDPIPPIAASLSSLPP